MWPFKKKAAPPPPLPAGIVVKNISPNGCEPFYEVTGRLVTRYSSLIDRAEKAYKSGQHAKAKTLSLEAWEIAPHLRNAEIQSASLNRHPFYPLACPALNLLSNIAYHSEEWHEVIRLHSLAVQCGWIASDMEGRVTGAKRKLEKKSPK
jgi:hypothetical protein